MVKDARSLRMALERNAPEAARVESTHAGTTAETNVGSPDVALMPVRVERAISRS
jgi:hypothetical protein